MIEDCLEKSRSWVVLVLMGLIVCPAMALAGVGPLAVSPDGHSFVDKNTGRSVFLLCDTGWNLLSLDYDDYTCYVESRVENRFNTIMFALSFEPQAKAENAYGERMYIGDGNAELNPKALAYVDSIVSDCYRRGLYVMLYCMWAGRKSGTMNRYTPSQLYEIGFDIGSHFGGRDNVIFVTGGESTPGFVDTVRTAAIGRGLKNGCGRRNLVGVHPTACHSSSEFFAECDWLDFNMIQGKSGTSGTDYNYEPLVCRDYRSKPARPTMLIENRYESGTGEDPAIQRRQLYISMLAGAAGWGYGHNALWQMTPNTGKPWMLRGWAPGTDSWKKVLRTKAVTQFRHVFTFLDFLPSTPRIPAQELLLSNQGSGINARIELARDGTPGTADATYIVAYIPSSASVSVDTRSIDSRKLYLWAFTPADGKIEKISDGQPNTGQLDIPAYAGDADRVIVIAGGKLGIDTPTAPQPRVETRN